MKNKIILTLSLICLSALSVFAQGDWSVGDQSYSPSVQPNAQGIPSTEKLTIQGTFSWVSFSGYSQNAHGMQLVYDLPACLDVASGSPALLYMDDSPVQGVTFTPIFAGYIANFAPGTTFPALTKLKFRISDLDIKDDQSYSNQILKHSVNFQTPAVGEQAANNSATISFNTTMVAGPLPIELLDFNAKLVVENNKHVVNLDWTTVTEINSAHFIVQKSDNSTTWEDVAKVKAAGNSSTNIDYVSTDDNPFMGLSYYRLKQVDMDGQFTYSPVRSIVWKLEGADNVRLHPNPTVDVINVTIDLATKSLMEVKITAIDGRVVQSAIAWMDKGNSNLELNLSTIANGIYNLTIYKNNKEYFIGKVQKL